MTRKEHEKGKGRSPQQAQNEKNCVFNGPAQLMCEKAKKTQFGNMLHGCMARTFDLKLEAQT